MTTVPNPWNVVYKLASGKMKDNSVISTLKRPDGSLTNNIDETMQYMMQQFIPQDQQDEVTEYHKTIRPKTQRPIETDDDREFTQLEIRQILMGMDQNKAPGEDGITIPILKQAFKRFPLLITAI